MRSACSILLLAGCLSLAQPARGATVRKATPVSPASTAATPVRSSTVVVIDAGHGGYDRGGIPGQRVPESVMTLDVAQRLRSILQASGYQTVMTRSSDVFVPLGTRVAIANSYRNAIFVCIHFNSATRRGAEGIETYFYSSQSLPLASAIHYYVAGGASSPNRGVRRRGYFVLRRTTIPSVLVECGFLTNPSEASNVQSSAYRQKLAEEIARGVRSRGSVANLRVINSPASPTMAQEAGPVPLQPFIDQTRVYDPDISRSKHSSKKSSKSKSSSSKSKKKKSSSDDSDSSASSSHSKKKKSSSDDDDSGASSSHSKKKKSSSDGDESGTHHTKKKTKPAPKKTED
jgi:N-acetylmuramoyl-L-alanine amidase